MRKRLLRFAAAMALPLAIGVVIGYCWSESARGGGGAAHAGAKPAAASGETGGQRVGAVIGLKPEKAEEYIRLHAKVWPEVLAKIRECNIRDFSIYLGKLDDGKLYLFSFYRYTGRDLEADMKKMAADPATQRWWKLTDPCQIPQKERKPGEHWMTLREVFHAD